MPFALLAYLFVQQCASGVILARMMTPGLIETHFQNGCNEKLRAITITLNFGSFSKDFQGFTCGMVIWMHLNFLFYEVDNIGYFIDYTVLPMQ